MLLVDMMRKRRWRFAHQGENKNLALHQAGCHFLEHFCSPRGGAATHIRRGSIERLRRVTARGARAGDEDVQGTEPPLDLCHHPIRGTWLRKIRDEPLHAAALLGEQVRSRQEVIPRA